MPVFGVYFPKAEDTVTRTKSTDNAALIIFRGLLEHEEQTKFDLFWNVQSVWLKKERYQNDITFVTSVDVHRRFTDSEERGGHDMQHRSPFDFQDTQDLVLLS